MVHSLIPLIHVSLKRSLGLRDGVRFANGSGAPAKERTDLVRRRRSERIWCAGEGTNGSVHSRFRPIGDALARTPISTKPSSSSDYSSFPSELPACPGMEVTLSGDSRKKLEENDNVRSERVLYDIVSKSISSAAVDYSSNGP
ncbi:hypothetical protein YC2023_040720 [Brassica napus]